MSIIDSITGIFSSKKSTGDNNKAAVQGNQTISSNVDKENVASSSRSGEPQPDKSFNNKGNAPIKKMKIYNLIVIDESGSMYNLAHSTISGVNEVINTIKASQDEFSETQEHFLSIVTFDSPGPNNQSVRFVIDCLPVKEVGDFKDYRPQGCTPLYDAMGISLTKIHKITKGDPRRLGSVTVVTDGLENASREWNAKKLRDFICQLKEEGWTFSYMGSAHDVKDVTDLLSIENFVEFSHDVRGTSGAWGRERSAKEKYFRQMEKVCYECTDDYDIMERKKQLASHYYEDRVTPDYIDHLEENEIFVFGSNIAGKHDGGASGMALNRFGAEYGKAEGLQGQSYAIPTVGVSFDELSEAVERFLEFAEEHRDLHFLVTRIGTGNAGLRYSQVARLFRRCIWLENVSLPTEFWAELGIRMYNKF